MQLPDFKIDSQPGVITLKTVNTTLGFVRYTETAEIEYIFVRRHYRRLGLARMLLDLVEEQTGHPVAPQEPISPLGSKLFESRSTLS